MSDRVGPADHADRAAAPDADMTDPDGTSRRPMPWRALILLAVACFTAVATETLPIGLLPLMARDLEVSESEIGLLVSVYAAAVVVASIPLNAWTAHLPRRPLLMGLIATYAVSNLILCLTDVYAVAAVARLCGGITHALFFAVLFGYATALAPPGRLGTALMVAGSGSSAAIAVGTPLGTLLGAAVGWRVSFGLVAVLSVLLVLAIRLWLPALPGSTVTGGAQLREVWARRSFRWLEVATLVVITGGFATYTYMAPIMIGFGWTETNVGIALLLYGAAALTGLFVIGRLADTRLRSTFTVMLGILIVVFVLIGVAPQQIVIGTVLLVAWGLANGSTNTFIQSGIIRAARGHPSTASAIHNAMFNVGIALGAFIGAQLLIVAPASATGFAAAIALLIGAPLMWYWLSPRRHEV